MKRSDKAILAYILFYISCYISYYFDWGHYSQYTLRQIAIEIGIFTILIILFYILREIEEYKEDYND